MNFTNKHIVLVIIIIIVFVFIYNYDVYVLPKNEQLCKPIYVTKRELTPEQRAELNTSQEIVFKETFSSLLKNNFFDDFNEKKYSTPSIDLSTYCIINITDPHKIKVMDNVIKVLCYVPTKYSEDDIKGIINYYSKLYQSSKNFDELYKTINTKIIEDPYYLKYSNLILYLIGKFNNQLNDTNEIKDTSSVFSPDNVSEMIIKYNLAKDNDVNKSKMKKLKKNKMYKKTIHSNLEKNNHPDVFIDRSSISTRNNGYSNISFNTMLLDKDMQSQINNPSNNVNSDYQLKSMDYLNNELSKIESFTPNNNYMDF